MNNDTGEGPSLKLRTARTLKWNTIDRVASQVVYALVGIVLANVLSQEDFGLVGVLLIFQAFATILTDSGFGAALLSKEKPTAADYSTVFWFNFVVSGVIYTILWFCAPLIAARFDNPELIPLSRVMFLSFVINGLAIVQVNKLMKDMNVRPLAISNTMALIFSGGVGVALALMGYGAWALVWQTVLLAAFKTSFLWVSGKWRPSGMPRLDSLKAIWKVGISVLTTSMLNTLCLQLYNIVIAAFYKTLQSLGIYTQADKWSKMGSASISQILTASFVPLLSSAQSDAERFSRYITKINRFTAFLHFPVLGGMAAVGEPLFHTLFGNKWDAAIPLFQILCLRGIFVVITSLHVNYLLSLGRAKSLIVVETVKDVLLIVAILSTIWFNSLTILVWGQFAASFLTYVIVTVLTSRQISYPLGRMAGDMVPFLIAGLCMGCGALAAENLFRLPLLRLIAGAIAGAGVYVGIAILARFPELKEAAGFLLGRFRRR